MAAHPDFPGRLKQLRLKLGLTQGQFAKRIGVTPSYVSRLESGDYSPSRELGEQIVEEFELPRDEWLGLMGYGPKAVVSGISTEAVREIIQETLRTAALEWGPRPGDPPSMRDLFWRRYGQAAEELAREGVQLLPLALDEASAQWEEKTEADIEGWIDRIKERSRRYAPGKN
jgi:transcriptional regulator with XRE-family HTH domain